MIFSFIVQGPITLYTQQVINSINDYYSDSEIILSTWEDEKNNVKNLFLPSNVNSVIYNSLSEAAKYNNHQNISKSMISSLSGLKIAKNKYSVKVRSDIMFINDNLKKNYHQYDNDKVLWRDKKIFFEKIKVSHWCCNADKKPLYMCDSIYSGLTIDLIKLFDVELIPVNVKKYNFIFKNSPSYNNMKGYHNQWDMGNENAVPLLSINKYLGYLFSNPENFISNDEKIINDQIIYENFIILDSINEYGIKFLKHPHYGINSNNFYYQNLRKNFNL